MPTNVEPRRPQCHSFAIAVTPTGQIAIRELDEPSRDEGLQVIDDLEQAIDADIATESF